jgi:hypothetical protein
MAPPTTSPSIFSWLPKPQPRSVTGLERQMLDTLIVTALVNPFGPTLFALVAIGPIKMGGTFELVRVQLNPFSQSAELVGHLTIKNTWTPKLDLVPAYKMMGKHCPSLFMVTPLMKDDAQELAADFISKLEGSRQMLDNVRKHYGDPWTRVGEEIEQAATRVAEGPKPSPPLSRTEAEELAGLLLAEKHWEPETHALGHAWKGAIEHTALPATMSHQEFLPLFLHIIRVLM